MNYSADIAIIGGGAAGLTAAITAKRKMPCLEVYIFEALDRVGKKLIATGNGRCNITNKNLLPEHFHGQDKDFATNIFSRYSNTEIAEFFGSLGVPFVFEGEKAFPASLQASSVVDCLRFECERLGVKTICGTKVCDISFKNPIRLEFDGGFATAKTVIAATGLYSGGDKLGSDGSFYRVLKNKGFNTVKISPSIVQIKTETNFVKQLKGIKTDAEVSLIKNNKVIKSQFGEVLFCDYGLSGPAVMNISREAFRTEEMFEIALDLFPNLSVKELSDQILERAKTLSHRSLEEFFTGMLNKRLGQVALKYADFKLSETATVIDLQAAEKIAFALKCFKFKVTGNTGFINSQVSAGGLSTSDFFVKTLMSKKYGGFFACGELLDIDGDCGGFNLAFAWASGMLAADSATRYLGEKQ